MAQTIDSRTVHIITIDVQDDILGKLELGDSVEVILRNRNGSCTAAKKLTFRDVDWLLSQ